jgi:hypothetical protein
METDSQELTARTASRPHGYLPMPKPSGFWVFVGNESRKRNPCKFGLFESHLIEFRELPIAFLSSMMMPPRASSFAREGSLMSYSAHPSDLFGRAAYYVDRILTSVS